MASKVQICNLALARINAVRITALTDNTNEAKLCNLLYDDIAAEVMTEGPWSSTVTRASLAVTSNTPTFGFDYEFQLPTSPKCLKVLNINDDVPGTHEFRVEGDKLLANISAVSIRYIGLITNPQSYDTSLKKAIVSRLAAEMSYPLTGNATLAQTLYERYKLDVQDGLMIDGQQGSNEITHSPDLTDDVR